MEQKLVEAEIQRMEQECFGESDTPPPRRSNPLKRASVSPFKESGATDVQPPQAPTPATTNSVGAGSQPVTMDAMEYMMKKLLNDSETRQKTFVAETIKNSIEQQIKPLQDEMIEHREDTKKHFEEQEKINKDLQQQILNLQTA